MKMWAFLFLLLPVAGLAYIGWHIWTILPLHWAWKTLVILCCVACFGLLILNFGGKFDSYPLPVA